MKFLRTDWFPVLLVIIILIVILNGLLTRTIPNYDSLIKNDEAVNEQWHAPDISMLPPSPENDLIRYGEQLIANTAMYLGPKGSVTAISNGMNCQNCHIDAGIKPYGNSFLGVASIYPAYRPRSGITESIEFRINDCFKRSLNGQTLDSLSKEMRAMVAYLKWVGKDVPKGVKPASAGTVELPFMNRAADTVKGKVVYVAKCQSCHGANGEGIFNADSSGFIYPPLWGKHSYNIGAGLYRLTRFASYVKYNMPFGTASYSNPQLTDEEAWDVAAFVNSQPRPEKFFSNDWPDITKKGIDYPYGPYADTFSAKQHKYGPFIPIKKAREEALAKNKNAGK